MEQHKSTPAGSPSDPVGTTPLSPIPQLTELFGPCGVGWWYEIPRREIYTDPATCQKGAFLDIRENLPAHSGNRRGGGDGWQRLSCPGLLPGSLL